MRLIIAEADSSGAMNRAESQMIAGVMRVADRMARRLMTPRNDVETLDAGTGRAVLLKRLHVLSRSRLKVWEGDVDNTIGVLTIRDILAPALTNEPFDLRALLREALVVRDGQSALEVVDRRRTSPAHTVLVHDEYGHFEGIITPMNVLEAIAGDFPDAVTDEPKVVTRADGCYLVAGWMPVDEFADLISLEVDTDATTRLWLVWSSTGLDICRRWDRNWSCPAGWWRWSIWTVGGSTSCLSRVCAEGLPKLRICWIWFLRGTPTRQNTLIWRT